MSKEEKSNEWDLLWQEYTKSLEIWKTLFEKIQNANKDLQAKFNEVWEKATKESSLIFYDALIFFNSHPSQKIISNPIPIPKVTAIAIIITGFIPYHEVSYLDLQ